MPGACLLGCVTRALHHPGPREEGSPQHLSASPRCSRGAEHPASRPGENGASRPGLLGSGWARGQSQAAPGFWESQGTCCLQDTVPNSRFRAPGFPDIELVTTPTPEGGGW